MSADRVTYLDASAIVKLVVHEPESTALRAYLKRKRNTVSSALARTEVTRAVLAADPAALSRASVVLDRIELLRITDRILVAAGGVTPTDVRSLDAIHIATAALFGPTLAALVTYDRRLAAAARANGMPTASPA